jgi:hypothetical protein
LSWPQRAQATVRRGAHLVQTGAFVSAKLQGRRRPQPEQVASGSWKHLSQMSGASPWARRAIRGDPSAPTTLALRAVRAAGADRPALTVATGDRFDDPAAGAGLGELAASTAGADPTGGRAGERLADPCADRAARLRQRRGSLGPQRLDEPTDHRRRCDGQRSWVGGQHHGQAAQRGWVARHRRDRGLHLCRRQGRVAGQHRGHDVAVALLTAHRRITVTVTARPVLAVAESAPPCPPTWRTCP